MATESAVLPTKDAAAVEEDYGAYLPHIRRRWLAEQAAWARRRQQAWVAVREAAAILRTRFGAREVVAFGSLTGLGPFTERSDVDLAVSGIPPGEFFHAWAAAGAACPLELDLVDLADCSPGLRRLIEAEGVPL
jgi:uncharacterized protein